MISWHFTKNTTVSKHSRFLLFAFFSLLTLLEVNPTNIKIHMVCIPQILFSALIMVSYVSFSDLSPYCNLCWTGIAIYEIYYLILDLEAGLIALPFLLGMGLLSNYIHAHFQDCTSTILVGAIIVHLANWAAQFYGHFHFEGNAPAVFDNLVQPLVLAPYFVIFEWMFIFKHRLPLKKKILRKVGAQRHPKKSN